LVIQWIAMGISFYNHKVVNKEITIISDNRILKLVVQIPILIIWEVMILTLIKEL